MFSVNVTRKNDSIQNENVTITLKPLKDFVVVTSKQRTKVTIPPLPTVPSIAGERERERPETRSEWLNG